jgi:hypothetical protein
MNILELPFFSFFETRIAHLPVDEKAVADSRGAIIRRPEFFSSFSINFTALPENGLPSFVSNAKPDFPGRSVVLSLARNSFMGLDAVSGTSIGAALTAKAEIISR